MAMQGPQAMCQSTELVPLCEREESGDWPNRVVCFCLPWTTRSAQIEYTNCYESRFRSHEQTGAVSYYRDGSFVYIGLCTRLDE